MSTQAGLFLCQRGLAHRQRNPLLCKNGIVHRTGKSIMQILLWGHQMTAGSLQHSSLRLISDVVVVVAYFG